MKHKLIVTLILLASALPMIAQQSDTTEQQVISLSLQEALDYAVKHNYTILNADLDVKKAKWQIWQTTAMGLPQVNGSVKYQQYPDIPTQLMPNFIAPAVYQINTESFGLQPIAPPPDPNSKFPVQFGSEYNMSWGVSVNQLIFSGEYIVGLQASRIFKDLAETNKEKSVRDLRASVEQTYVLALIALESERIIKETYNNTVDLRDKTKQLIEAGMGEPTQLDQMNLVLTQLDNQLKSIERQTDITLRLLKFQLGIDFQDSLVMTTTLDDLVQNMKLGDVINRDFSLQKNLDYKLVMTQEELKKLDMRREEAKMLPQVMGFYTYSKNAMRDEFNFQDPDQPWYKTSFYGVQINIPIFGSGSKIASVAQKKIEYDKAQNNRAMMEQQLNIQYQQALNGFINAYEKMLNSQHNINLAQKVYENTKIKYQNGSASSLELTQAQNQYLQAQGDYYSAMMELVKAKTDLDKLVY